MLRNSHTAKFGEDSLQSRDKSVHIPSLIARVDMSLEAQNKDRDQVSPQDNRCPEALSTRKNVGSAGSAQAVHVFIQPWGVKQKGISTTGICQP